MKKRYEIKQAGTFLFNIVDENNQVIDCANFVAEATDKIKSEYDGEPVINFDRNETFYFIKH